MSYVEINVYGSLLHKFHVTDFRIQGIPELTHSVQWLHTLWSRDYDSDLRLPCFPLLPERPVRLHLPSSIHVSEAMRLNSRQGSVDGSDVPTSFLSLSHHTLMFHHVPCLTIGCRRPSGRFYKTRLHDNGPLMGTRFLSGVMTML